MVRSNYDEIRRVRCEMSREVGGDLRRYLEVLAETRQRVASRLVCHGAEGRSKAEDASAADTKG